MSSNPHTDWRPPSGFVPVPSALPGVEVYAPAPEKPAPDRRTFKCPRCGASTAYSAAEAALTCAHCGYVEVPEAPVVGRQAEQAEFTIETLERVARGWGGRARREIHCESCGANISLEPTDLTAACPFCASPRVVARQETHANMLRPGHLIPFQVDRASGARLLREWLSRGWMHPPELRRVGRSVHLSGVYLSFWTFSARLDTNWQAEVGRKHTRRTWDGKRKTEVKWEPKSGHLDLRVDDMLIPGSNKVSTKLLRRLYPFDLTALTVYDSAYLAGWRAQAYDVGLRPAWDQARVWMRERAKEAAYKQIDSKHVRNFGMTAELEEERWRYLLLPVYVVAYRFGDRVYQVLINGQTGQMAGQKPVVWLRVWGVLALLMLPSLVLAGLGLLLRGGAAGALLMIAFGALVIGLAVAAQILRQAMAAGEAG